MAPDAEVRTDEADADDTPDGEPLAMTWSVGRVAAVVTLLAMIAFWAWVFSGAPKRSNPDYLHDREYASALEDRCQQLRDDLDTLPAAPELPDRDERADVLVQANAMVGDFIDDVAAAAPTEGSAGTAMEGWLADWRTYLADREAYVEQLRTTTDDRFYVTKSPLGRQVDETIEVFAEINGIPTCATPGDVG
ncbi:MAG: hypothetical protein R2701_05735 [Acidimicrobiales bacterium]|nr:hypothetical protein [Acidimicrobiales bacterium]